MGHRLTLDDFVWKVYELTKPLAETATKRRPESGSGGGRSWRVAERSPAMRKVVRRNSAFWVAAFVGAASLVAASSAYAFGVPGASGSAAGRGIHFNSQVYLRSAAAARAVLPALGSPSDTGASNISNLGTSGWKVQSSASATQSGAQISTPGFNTSS